MTKLERVIVFNFAIAGCGYYDIKAKWCSISSNQTTFSFFFVSTKTKRNNVITSKLELDKIRGKCLHLLYFVFVFFFFEFISDIISARALHGTLTHIKKEQKVEDWALKIMNASISINKQSAKHKFLCCWWLMVMSDMMLRSEGVQFHWSGSTYFCEQAPTITQRKINSLTIETWLPPIMYANVDPSTI